MKRYVSLIALIMTTVMVLTSCGGSSGDGNDNGNNGSADTQQGSSDNNNNNNDDNATAEDENTSSYVPPASDTVAELTIMMWSGDGSFMQDVGNRDIPPEEILGQNQGAAYATARAFKELYPNVKINVYAIEGGPNDSMPWAQARENFRAEYGKYPDLYAATDLIADMQKGMIADISIFADDPMYQSFNPSVMQMMNFEGRQLALPQYLLPWGVFVNKSLAESKNIDVPPIDWTIDQYTSFISHSEANDYYGTMDPPMDFIRTGTKDFAYNLKNRNEGDPYVRMNSDAVRRMLEYIPAWSNHAVNPQNDLGRISSEFMEANWSWSYAFFMFGKLLTLSGDPWMMGDAAHVNPEHWGRVQADDWDIYPRPSTAEQPNTIGVVLDPFVIHNYAMDDGNAELNEEEYAKLQIAYEFAKFWCGDTRAWQARADQLFWDDGGLKSAMNDSFPLVTGEEFGKQMEIWYQPDIHQRFADANKMPGFQYVLELWESGQFWDVSDKSYPWTYEHEGSSRVIMYEWENYWNPEITGAARTDANWLDQIYARLDDWNEQFNRRWEEAYANAEAALERYYPR